MMHGALQGTARSAKGKRDRPLVVALFHAYHGWMNDFLIFGGVLVAWFLVVRFVFPKLGIRG